MMPCKDCRALWPFAFALALAALVTFPAWATLNLMDTGPATQLVGTALVFCITGAAFVLYVRWCIKRDCALKAAAARRGGLVAAER